MTFKPDPKYEYYINLVNGFQINILRIIKTQVPSFITHFTQLMFTFSTFPSVSYKNSKVDYILHKGILKLTSLNYFLQLLVPAPAKEKLGNEIIQDTQRSKPPRNIFWRLIIKYKIVTCVIWNTLDIRERKRIT